MDRSFAGRLGIGSPTRPAGSSAKRRKPPAAGARASAGAAHGAPRLIDRAIERLLRVPAAAPGVLRGAWSLLAAHRRLRLAVIAMLIAAPLLGGGWLWLRQSSLVSVEHVKISGLHGSDASAIEGALSGAAKRMSTLDVHSSQLRAAVAAYPAVGELKVSASFPHNISIRVVEQPPVAALTVGGVKTAVAANGVVLGPGRVSSALPTLSGAVQLSPGQHVREPALRDDLTVLGAAPAALAKDVQRAYGGSKGLTLVMHSGLVVYFGDATLPHAKWLSLARVLAAPSSAGASYIDVRLPERPAAGFPAGAAPASAQAGEGEASTATPSASESAESLAEGLSSAVGGTGAETKSAASEESSTTETAPSGESEAATESSGEAPASGSTESSESHE